MNSIRRPGKHRLIVVQVHDGWCIRLVGDESTGQASPPGGWDRLRFPSYSSAAQAVFAIEVSSGLTAEEYMRRQK